MNLEVKILRSVHMHCGALVRKLLLVCTSQLICVIAFNDCLIYLKAD